MLDMNMVLESAWLVYSPGQHDQHYRPLTDISEGDSIDDLLDATDGGRTVTPVTLTRLAGRLVVPSHTASRKTIDIPGSMRQARFAFTLSFIITSTGPGSSPITEREIVRGFTNHAELSRGNFIPDDMEFHVNSRVLLKVGRSVGRKVIETRSVQLNHAVLGRNNGIRNAVALRPEDIVASAQSANLRSSGAHISDNRSYLDGISKVADRKHTVPSKWLSSTLLGYRKGMNVNTDPEYFAEEGDYAQIYGKVITSSLTNSHFYNAMTDGRVIGFGEDNVFTFREIDTMFHLSNDKWVKVVRNNKDVLNLIDSTCDWRGSQMETIIAYNLSHIMPSTMNQLLLTRLEVIITNDNIGNEIEIEVINYRKMFDDNDDTDEISELEYIIDQLELDVVHGLLENNHIPVYRLHINSNITWNSIIKIQLDGGRVATYSAPQFCDGYTSPLIDLEEDNLHHISQTIDHLAVNLVEATREKRTAFSDFFDQANDRKLLIAGPRGHKSGRREVRTEGGSKKRIVTLTR